VHNIKNNSDIYLIISNNIKKYRLASNMTQKELAVKSGYCTKNFSIQTLQNISNALNIDIKYLFDNNNI